MSNLAMKLDTLSYAKKLIAAGCEPKLAEAHASLQQDVWIEVSEDYLSQFATKQDLEGLRLMTKQEFAIIRKEMNILFYRTVISLGTISVLVGGACLTILKFIL